MKVPVLNGTLDVGHRPKLKEIPHLPYDIIVTCLTNNEGGSEIASAVRATGKKSIWLDFVLRHFPHNDYKFIVDAVNVTAFALNRGYHVFIHCSAGLHRTGVVAYSVLRKTGLDGPDALTTLHSIRPATAEEMVKFMPIADKIVGKTLLET